MSSGSEERRYVVGLAGMIVVCGALAIRDRGEPPRDVARGAATLLTIIGAIGIALTRARRAFRRLRGKRHPNEWTAEWLFFTGGLGWALFLPGAAALVALHGDPGVGAYLVAGMLAAVTLLLVSAGAFLGLAFLPAEKEINYALLAIVHLPAVLFLSIALRLLAAAWRAI